MSRKSSSVVVLTATLVLACAVFCFSWLVRPNDESDVLAKARARQNESLITVAEPLETDRNVLTKEEEMKNSVYSMLLADDSFAQAVGDKVSSDAAFQDTVYQSMLPRIDSYLDGKINEYVAIYAPRIEEEVRTLFLAQDPTTIVDSLIEPVTVKVYADLSRTLTSDTVEALKEDYRASYEAMSADIENDVYARLSTDRASFVADVKAEVIAELEARMPAYVEEVRAELDKYVTEADVENAVITVYNKYQDEVITEVVQEVLSQLDTVAVAAAETRVAEEPAPVVEEVVAEEPAPVVEEVVAEEPAPVVEEAVAEEPAPVVEEAVAEEPAAVGIQAPSFSSQPTVKEVSSLDYLSQRKAIREERIKEVLDKLN